MRAARSGSMVLLLAALCQCRGEPAPSVSPAAARPTGSPAEAPLGSAVAPGPTAAVASALPSVSLEPPPAPSASAPLGGSAAVPSPDETQEPPLLASDGSPLPQTEERPSVTSSRFLSRMQRLADAILTGEPERARDTFFPLVAYAQVKDVQKPERDYRYRLMAHFDRDVREYRKRLGAGAEFVGVSVPEARAEWMKPGKEGNRIGYFRVLRSRLRFRLPSGKEQALELTSMISWRGEWYVVHLHGFE